MNGKLLLLLTLIAGIGIGIVGGPQIDPTQISQIDIPEVTTQNETDDNPNKATFLTGSFESIEYDPINNKFIIILDTADKIDGFFLYDPAKRKLGEASVQAGDRRIILNAPSNPPDGTYELVGVRIDVGENIILSQAEEVESKTFKLSPSTIKSNQDQSIKTPTPDSVGI